MSLSRAGADGMLGRVPADEMNAEPRDLLRSMKGGVLTLFVLAWNAPLVALLLWKGFSFDQSLLFGVIAVQVAWLVIACLVVAASPAAHRWVFRDEVPEGYFRRNLRVSAAAYGVLGVLFGAASFLG